MKHSYVSVIAFLCLAGCTHTIYVDKPRDVTVYVPVVGKLPAELTADCAPAPLAGVVVSQVLDRHAAVEVALADCRDRMKKIREGQPDK